MSENNEDLQKLLEIAKTPTKEKITPKLDYSQAYQFALEFSIEQGSEKVPASLIYDLYKEWKKTNLVTKTKFFLEFKHYFIKVRKTEGIYYLLNYSAKDLQKLVGEKINA